MKLKQISFIGLVLLLFFLTTQSRVIFARTTTQYQLYRLSDDSPDDRRPKLAINDQGLVWVVWESDRDGDFDIYGRKFENGIWTDVIAFASDTNVTFLCDVLFAGESQFFVFGTEVDLRREHNPYYFNKSQLFLLSFLEDAVAEKQLLAEVHHWHPYWSNHQYYPDDMPKTISFDQNIFVCYHREFFSNSSFSYDSLFLKNYKSETWYAERCDSIFEQYDAGIMRTHFYTFPTFSINMINRGMFAINDWEDWHGGGPASQDIGLMIGNDHIPHYLVLTQYVQDLEGNRLGFQSYCYGSNSITIFLAGFFYKEKYSFEKTHLIKQVELINDTLALEKKAWRFDFKENIKISQMSDLVAFAWSDTANIYVKTFQDSIWYETLEIPLNGLTHIDQSLNCAVYNNQLIWITFDAIYNGNKDVYALSVPASFVVDTVLTSVSQRTETITFPNDFALFQNYPNPFNSSTTIKYSLPQHKSSYHVTLKIYDIRGRLVNKLVDQHHAAGNYSVNWNGKDKNGKSVSSGIYFYRLDTQKFRETKKLIIQR